MAGTRMAEPPGLQGWIQHMLEQPHPSWGPGAQVRSVHFHSNGPTVGGLDEAVPQGSFEGSLQTEELIRMVDSERAHAQDEVSERALHETPSEITVNNQQQWDPPPCTTRLIEPRKGTRKRDRDRNWTDEETAVLVECKRTAFHDKGSPFRKPKSNATNWDAISDALRNNPVTRASEKTGGQCRLRWDTLVKSHRIIKEKCMQKNKGYADLTEEEMHELKLATTLDNGWYEVIDTIKSNSVTRSQKRGNVTHSVGSYANPESRMANVPLGDVVSSRNAATDPESHPLFLDGARAVSMHKSPPSSPPTQDPPGRLEGRKSSRKQTAIPGFSSMNVQLRAMLLDLILGVRFLKGRFLDSEGTDTVDGESLSVYCEWLSIVQNRSCSEIYGDVNMLLKWKLVHIFVDSGGVYINRSRFRVFDKFVKKVILRNPVYDTHLRIHDRTIWTLEAVPFVPQQIRVLKLDGCEKLKSANLRGLRKLRSLVIFNCSKLVEVTGWKYLRELGWLEIQNCNLYRDYPDLQDLPFLREYRFHRVTMSECSPRGELGISQCVRLRRLEIWRDVVLEESGDLSSLRCLEVLSFDGCTALSTISGLSGLHLLTSLKLSDCKALQSLPDIGHMKELVCLAILWTGLEEIPGVEKLVSLKMLDCDWSKLKRLPDLHHLPELRVVYLRNTPLIEDDPSSFYFDKKMVVFNREERGYVDVSDISDTEYNVSGGESSFSDDSLSYDDAD